MFRIGFFLFMAVVLPLSAFAQTATQVAERRAALERDLVALEAEIAVQQQLLDAKRTERVSLERDVAILDAQIEKARLQIRARTLAIEKLSGEIGTKRQVIGALGEKLERERQSLAQILRRTNEIDEVSVVEVAFGTRNVSAFFEDLDAFTSVKAALSDSFDEIETTRVVTEEEKAALETRHAEEVELRTLQELEKRKIETQEAEKQRILNATKGQEAAYQKLVSDKEKTAAQIRAELFTLRDSAAIPFGTALDLAEKAERATGVRAALTLAVLKQETRLGEYIGTGTWIPDMHPTRDRPVFVYIMKTLGLDPDRMPVSKKPSYGWGGAMGPSQFIPSTWVCYGGFVNTNTNGCSNKPQSMSWNGFWQGPWEYVVAKDRIRKLIGGNDPSNPWTNEDAFMATALLMSDNGADKKTRAAERLAALRYFAGWNNAEKSAYAFYGDAVMEFADFFQKQIDILGS